MKTPQVDPAIQAQEYGFHIVFKGYEHMRLLAHAFPLPYPGRDGGDIRFYETLSGHTFDFLAEVSGKTLEVRIESLHESPRGGTLDWELSGVRVFTDKAAADWDRGTGPLVVSAVMTWDKDAVRRVPSKSASAEIAQ